MGKRTLGRWAVGLLLLAGLSARAEADKKTERTWRARCASCHGGDGSADTEVGKQLKIADLTKADWQSKTDDAAIKKAIADGAQRDGQQVMESYKDALSAEQIDALVKYIRGLKK